MRGITVSDERTERTDITASDSFPVGNSSFRPLSIPNHISRVNRDSDIAVILRNTEKNAVIEERAIPEWLPPIQEFFRHPDLKFHFDGWLSEPNEVYLRLKPLLARTNLLKCMPQESAMLLLDVHALVSNMFTLAAPGNQVHLRLSNSAPPNGSHWHSDLSHFVGLITYDGTGTEWIANKYVSRYGPEQKATLIPGSERHIKQMPTNSKLILRGDMMSGLHRRFLEGLVHRRPPGNAHRFLAAAHTEIYWGNE